MATVPPPRDRARPALSRAAVLDGAVALADAEGLGAVTVRRLAAALGVTPMALYWHVATKDDLVAALADRVLDAVRVPEETGDWEEDLRAALLALVAALRPHPQLAPLVADRLLEHPGGLALSEAALRCLAAAGHGPQPAGYLASQALRTAITAVTGDRPAGADDPAGAQEHEARLRRQQAALAALPPDHYPALVAHAAEVARCTGTDAHVALAVDVFVTGVRGAAARGAVVAGPTAP